MIDKAVDSFIVYAHAEAHNYFNSGFVYSDALGSTTICSYHSIVDHRTVAARICF